MPGGTVAAVPAAVGILRRQRVDPAISATALLGSGVVSSLVLVFLLPVASASACWSARVAPSPWASAASRWRSRSCAASSGWGSAAPSWVAGHDQSSGLAAASWSCDFAVMAAVAVVGTRGAPLAGMALAYIVGQLAAAVPLTPGGVGVVEATTTGALAAQGVPAGQAAAVVLAWRLVSHWLPIVAGLVVYAGVHRAPDPA
jgi:uncharacterized membrane protein YbhN (UPF0104 family)